MCLAEVESVERIRTNVKRGREVKEKDQVD